MSKHESDNNVRDRLQRFIGKRVDVFIRQSPQGELIRRKDETKEINRRFTQAAEDVVSFFQMDEALKLRNEQLPFFQERLAVAIAAQAIATPKYVAEEGREIHVGRAQLAIYQETASRHHRTSDLEDLHRTEVEWLLNSAAKDCLTRIWTSGIHPVYLPRLLSYVAVGGRFSRIDLAGKKEKDIESYRQQFTDDAVIRGYRERLSALNTG